MLNGVVAFERKLPNDMQGGDGCYLGETERIGDPAEKKSKNKSYPSCDLLPRNFTQTCNLWLEGMKPFITSLTSVLGTLGCVTSFPQKFTNRKYVEQVKDVGHP